MLFCRKHSIHLFKGKTLFLAKYQEKNNKINQIKADSSQLKFESGYFSYNP